MSQNSLSNKGGETPPITIRLGTEAQVALRELEDRWRSKDRSSAIRRALIDSAASLKPTLVTKGPPEARMTHLCAQLPYLADKPGFGLGWDTDLAFPGEPLENKDFPLPKWARGSSAAREAVVFAWHVWNSNSPAPSLAFWDRVHRTAYLRWAEDPWWC